MYSCLFVPTRFTAVAETDLKDPLKALGITDMFDQSKANFAKITSKFFACVVSVFCFFKSVAVLIRSFSHGIKH